MKKRIMFFGDSICAGSDIPDGSMDDAWPMVFARLNTETCEVDNQSRGGRPTDSLKDFEIAFEGKPAPDILVIALGANDARDLSDDMPSKACANIRKMLQLARGKGVARLIVLGPSNINKEALEKTYPIRHEREGNLRKLNAAYRELAAEEKIEFLSTYGVIPEERMTRDGVHPDVEGEKLLAEFFLSYLSR